MLEETREKETTVARTDTGKVDSVTGDPMGEIGRIGGTGRIGMTGRTNLVENLVTNPGTTRKDRKGGRTRMKMEFRRSFLDQSGERTTKVE